MSSGRVLEWYPAIVEGVEDLFPNTDTLWVENLRGVCDLDAAMNASIL